MTSPAIGAQGVEPDTAKSLRASANIGFLDASGNTDVTSLNAG